MKTKECQCKCHLGAWGTNSKHIEGCNSHCQPQSKWIGEFGKFRSESVAEYEARTKKPTEQQEGWEKEIDNLSQTFTDVTMTLWTSNSLKSFIRTELERVRQEEFEDMLERHNNELANQKREIVEKIKKMKKTKKTCPVYVCCSDCYNQVLDDILDELEKERG